MKIYDISQEVFSCAVYPGDTAPAMQAVKRTADGDLYNLTDIAMCAHNGTHIDAPFHFLGEGKTVDQIPLQKTVGECYVAAFDGEMTAADAERILQAAAKAKNGSETRILLKGESVVTAEAAKAFAAAEIDLLGVESQSVGDANAPMEVHKILLGREVVLLEGIRLTEVPEGAYFLSAAPLNLAGLDGAPVRAFLISK